MSENCPDRIRQKWRLPLGTSVDGEEAVGGCLRTWYLMKEEGVGKQICSLEAS